MATVADVFALALQHHGAGDLHQAQQLYRQVIDSEPRHADAHHLYGVAAYQLGQFEQAVESIRHAISLQPSAAAYYSNLALVYECLGQLDNAVASCQEALRLAPAMVEAHNNLGNALCKQRKWEEALGQYREALRLKPDYAEAHCGLGMVLSNFSRFDEAANHLREALRLNPNYAEAHNNLANVLLKQGKLDEGISHCRLALRVRPGFAEAQYNLGSALHKQDKLEEASHHYHLALRLRPDFPEAHNCLANILLRQGSPAEAAPHYQHALRSRPDYPEAHNGLGTVFERLGNFTEAVACYQRAARYNPKLAEPFFNLGNAFRRRSELDEAARHFREAIRLKPCFAEACNNLASILMEQGKMDEALPFFHQALQHQPDLATAQSNYLFCLNYDPKADLDFVFAEYCRWGKRYERTSGKDHANDPHPSRRLRIGYVSPDFRRHALRRYIEPVLAHHDPRQVEVVCYAEVACPDPATDFMRSLVHGWRWIVGQSDAQVAQCVRDDRIDILVDLAGHSGNNRLRVFAQKPAPVQATWLGFLNTTGLTSIDYRLTDELLDPPGEAVRDTEKLWRLPGGMCTFAQPGDEPAVGSLPAIKNGYITFGSLHNLFKLNATVFDVWSEVLRATPNSRLFMFRDSLGGSAQEQIRKQFAERGIGGERLELQGGQRSEGYLGIYRDIDVSLDVFPCTGGVTTCESLWMGVPVVSLCGQRPLARNSAALLTRVGLGDWVVKTPQEYVALAANLSGQIPRLAELRAGLRQQVLTQLCDAERFTRILEDAYRQMWQGWCAKRRSGS